MEESSISVCGPETGNFLLMHEINIPRASWRLIACIPELLIQITGDPSDCRLSRTCAA